MVVEVDYSFDILDFLWNYLDSFVPVDSNFLLPVVDYSWSDLVVSDCRVVVLYNPAYCSGEVHFDDNLIFLVGS